MNFEYPKFEDLNAANCREVSIKIHYPEFWSYLHDNYGGVPFAQKIYLFYHHLDTPPVCACGNKTAFLGFRRGYREFCSHKCMNSCADIQDRKRQTSLKNYGATSPMHTQEVRDKLKQSIRTKYGVDNPFQSPELMKRSKVTCMERYGTEYANQSDEVKRKIKQSKQNGVLERIQGVISIESGDGTDIYTMKCPDTTCNGCTEKVFKIKSGILYDRTRLGVDICTTRYPVGSHIRNTSLEKFIKDILDEYSIEYSENDRKVLQGKELDIYIPTHNLAIECNGVYWHSMYDSKYHYNKWKVCKEQGIQLLSIWEDWITTKPEIVKDIVLSKLGIYDTSIGAGKCKVVKPSANQVRVFLDENHIQGFCNSTLKYGLEYRGELVAVMIFSRENNPATGQTPFWTLQRFCNKRDMHVVAGASRLLAHFLKEHPGVGVISYACHDISNGALYEKLGFEYAGMTQSEYWYVHNQSHRRYHRSSFMKKDLVRKGYDSTLTEEQIMMQTDYLRIYDSGQSKYILKNTGQ